MTSTAASAPSTAADEPEGWALDRWWKWALVIAVPLVIMLGILAAYII